MININLNLIMGLIIFLVILVIFIIGIIIFLNYQKNNINNFQKNNISCNGGKNTFYGLPPGRHRAVGVNDLGNDLGWATFSNNNIAQLNNDCSWCGPLDGLNNYCNLFGHQGTTPSAMVNYVEFSPNVN